MLGPSLVGVSSSTSEAVPWKVTPGSECKFRLVSNDIYATDLLFSPRAPVRLSVCVKHALGGQTYPHIAYLCQPWEIVLELMTLHFTSR